jgi:hypothetical protein
MRITEAIRLRRVWTILSVFACAYASFAYAAEPTWFEQHRGQDVVVHYVHLTGHLFDNDAQRGFLQIDYDRCVTQHRMTGRPFKPLPPGGLPEVPFPEDHEIYYGENRSVVISSGKTHSIDSVDCSLKLTPNKYMTMPVGSGECSVNLLENTASGICKERKPGANDNAISDRPSSSPRFMGDLSAVPPARQAEILAWAERIAARPRAPSTEQSTGEYRSVAGYRCAVYGEVKLVERCIARPKSDFVFPPNSANAFIPGLLLQIRSPGMTMDAQEVTLNMKVSQSLFEIPAGVKVRTSSRGKR